MNVLQLLSWQWNGYPRYHRSRQNLLVHIAAVPLFLVGNVALVVAAIEQSAFVAVLALIGMVVSVALQRRGHRLEEVPPEPFSGVTNAVARIFLEQSATFPRFVVSGD